MMAINREKFRQFLTTHNVSKTDADDLMAAFEGYFKQAESGLFVFGAEPDIEEAREAIALFTGQEVAHVVAVPAEPLGPAPRSLSGIISQGRDEDDFWNCFRYGLEDCLCADLKMPRKGELMSGLRSSLYCNLSGDLTDSYANRGLMFILDANIKPSLFGYASLVLRGRKNEAVKCVRLIRFMSQNPVLGKKKDFPANTWFIIKS